MLTSSFRCRLSAATQRTSRHPQKQCPWHQRPRSADRRERAAGGRRSSAARPGLDGHLEPGACYRQASRPRQTKER